VCNSAAVRTAVCGSAAVYGNAAARQRVLQSVRRGAALRAAVCGSARGGVCLFVFTLIILSAFNYIKLNLS
jgi:hypothetical protein